MNTKQREVSSLNGKSIIYAMRNIYIIPIPNALKRAYSVWNNYQSRMSWGWEID